MLAAMLVMIPTARAEVTDELWPEFDLWFHVIEPLRFLLTYTGTRDAESGDKSQGTFGASVDYRLNDSISFRAGYEYLENLRLSNGAREDVEHRQTYDFNYNLRLTDSAQLSDRTRVDVRDQEGETTYRYRNRLRFQDATEIRQTRLVPYASAEVFYDTQYDRIDRLQFRLGTSLPTGPNVEWDFYLARQRDTQPTTKFVDAIGITLNIKY
jgi:hypothetical protein